MIYEIALLPVKTDQIPSFTRAFGEVAHLLRRAKGYLGHQLMQGVETPSHFSLIVRWQALEDHTRGFEPSRDHEVFMAGLREYLADEPTVHHVQAAVPLEGTEVFGP